MSHVDVLRALLKEPPNRGYLPTDGTAFLTVDEKTLNTLNQIHACFLAWESQVCVVGNVRAEDGANALHAIIRHLRPALPDRARPAAPVPPAVPKANPREPEAFLVRFRGISPRRLWPAFRHFAPGVRWSNCSKTHLANAWAAAGTGSSAYKQLADVTLDMIEEHLE